MARTRRSTEPERRRARVLITGGTGFIGRSVVRLLSGRGDDVTAIVRDARKAADLSDLGVTVVEDDLSDVDRLTSVVRQAAADAIVHAAGSYRIGIRREERGAMWDANVGTTTRILDAAEAAGTPRFVYLSTVNVFGNTKGVIVDETYRRDLTEGFLSWYDETKYGAHEVAEQRIAGGAPVIVAMPGIVIGPGDHSEVGRQLALAHGGKLSFVAAGGMGITPVHVDDEAAGIAAVLDRGAIGRAYVLAGDCVRLGEALGRAAALGGKGLPWLRIPDGVLRSTASLGRLMGLANARETISASVGVTYWASSKRAEDELGWTRRDAEAAIRDTFSAA